MNFFSKFFKKSSPKGDKKITESKFLPKKKAVIEERFILKFIENGGKFLYCENLNELQKNFDLILDENEWINKDVLVINTNLKKKYSLSGNFSSSLEESNLKSINPNHRPPRRIWHPCRAGPRQVNGVDHSTVTCLGSKLPFL